MTAVTILVESVTLARLIRSNNYKSFVKITAMFLLANVVTCILFFFDARGGKYSSNQTWFTAICFLFAIENGL